MVRPRTIDREELLDAAESVLTAGSAASLSFGSVAIAAGVAKASVQSVFKTREVMIDALLDRWARREQLRFEHLAGERPTERARLHAHITTTEQEEAGGRVASLLAALAGSGAQSEGIARWYAARVGKLTARTPEQHRLRIAFLAAEGAFFLRYLVGLRFSAAQWRALFADLHALVDEA